MKEEILEYDGIVMELRKNAMYIIKLDNGHQITAITGGRLRRNRIRILQGDRVKVSVSPYDLTKGRVTFRY